MRHDVAPVFAKLQEMAGTDGRDVGIFTSELLGVATQALASREAWRGKIVLYAGDNTNVVGWLQSRSAGNRYANRLLRVITYHEVLCGFRIDGFYTGFI